jgi:hypothetical protein
VQDVRVEDDRVTGLGVEGDDVVSLPVGLDVREPAVAQPGVVRDRLVAGVEDGAGVRRTADATRLPNWMSRRMSNRSATWRR